MARHVRKVCRLPFLWLLTVALTALAAPARLPGAAAQTPPPGPCEDGYVAPTPTDVAVTSVPITVSSTTADYFVLYVQVANVRSPVKVVTPTSSIPISVTRGVDGKTTLSDSLAPLSVDRYSVEKYSVANPADIDGDCVDDLTELDDQGKYNPINPGKAIDLVNGTVSIDSLETFQELSLDGDTGFGDWMRNLEFIKFSIHNIETDNPTTYFLNTNTTLSHGTFNDAIDLTIPTDSLLTRGQIVYHPNVSAPDGSLGIYRFNFDGFERGGFKNIAKFNEILAAAMPLLENDLFYYPVTNEQLGTYQQEKAQFDASRVNVLKAEDINADVDFIALNQAEGYGRLRLMEDGDRPSPFDVAIYTSLPNDLPRVAGTITTVQQTPLSHVNLRAIQNGLPNAYIQDVLKDDAIKALLNGYVYYAVTADGYTLRAATKKEVDDHHESLRPANTQTLQRDLTVTVITSLSKVNFADWTAFGVKAANVAELTKLSLPSGTTPVGFAVPFYFYDEFMKQATLGEETILGKKKAPAEEKITLAAGTTLASAVTAMLAHPKFQSDADIQEEMLDDLRDAIKDATSPAWIITALEDMHDTYPDGQSLRYRSSTNNEDLPSFNGAGLYSSKTQDPDETTDDGIDKSIKAVWASLWNYRAFLERDFHRVDHNTVAMGVLVHPNYSDELVNGVAVSYDPITFQDNVYYVNSQVGEDLVTNPEANSLPEQLLLGSTGAATMLTRSNLAPSDNPLMSDAQMRQLRSNLETIHDRFETLYGVQDGDDFAIEIEFKITAENKLAIKQARPWIFPEPLELTLPTVTIELDSATATEDGGLELTATREGGILSQPLAIDLTWSETGTMLKSATPASVTIPGNQTSASIPVPVDDDQDDEHESVVTVTIATDSDYTIGTPGSAEAMVTDDDLTNIAVRADAGTVTEGSPVGFTFTRSGSVLEQPLTVGITVSGNGNRLPGSLPTAVTFAANSATATVSFTTVDDSIWTGRSVATVQIDAGSGYGISGTGKAQVTVKDDEPQPPTLLFDFNHAAAGGRNYVLTIETSRPKGTMSFALSGPDTDAFVDYTFADILMLKSQQYDLPADANQDGVYEIDLTATDSGGGATTVRLRFTVVNDELIALAAQQWDQLSQDDRVALLPEVESALLQPAFASLHSDVRGSVLRLARQQQLPSPGPTISIAADGDITEGGDATFTVGADPAPSAPLSVSVAVSQTGDFGVVPGSHTVTIPTTGSVPVTIATSDDSVDEANGSVTATVDRGNGYVVSWPAGSATVAVADDDAAPPQTVPEISITADGDITEGGDATFTVTANPAPTSVLAVTVAVTATGNYGVTPASPTVTISTGGTGTLTIPTTDDSTDEANGSVTATITDGTDYDVSSTAGAATVTVADDDDAPPPPACTATDPAVTAVPGLTPAARATLAADCAVLLDNMDILLGTDPDRGSLNWAADRSMRGWNGVYADPNGRVTDLRLDGRHLTGQIPAALGALDGLTTLNLHTNRLSGAIPDLSALTKLEYLTLSNNQLSGAIPAALGSLTHLASLHLAANPLTGGIPSQLGGLTSLTHLSLCGTNLAATATLPAALEARSGLTVWSCVRIEDATALEGSGLSFSVERSTWPVRGPAGPRTVSYTITDDTTTSADYTGAAGSVTIPVNTDPTTATSTGTITIATTHDADDEADETLTVSLSADWTSLHVMPLRSVATGTIQNNDGSPPPPPTTPEVRITADGDITEGGAATFTLTASPAPAASLDVTVSVTVSGDFGVSPASHTVTIPTTGTGTLTVATSDDSVDEPHGSVTATITDDPAYAVSATAGAATVAVADDDAAPPPPVCTPQLPSDAVTVTEVTGWRDGHPGAAHVRRWNRVLEALGADTGSGATPLTAAESEANESQFMASRWDRVTRTLEAIEQCADTTTTVVPPPPTTPEVRITADGDITEGGAATFTLTASPAPAASLDVTVSVTVSGDFGVSPASHTVTIPTTGTGTLTVATSDDSVDEPHGSVTATITDDPAYAVSATAGAATVAVADDDAAPPPPVCTPQLPSDAVTVTEVTGWRDGHPGAAHVRRWNRVLEALGADTGSGATPLTAAESEANESQFMASRWDRVTRTLEAIEQCADTTTTVVPPPPTTPEVRITADGDITEGGAATFTLTASPAPAASLDVTVSVTVSGDFGVSPASHTVTIPTTGTGTLTVATSDDSVDEPHGSVTATITDDPAYAVSATAGAATVAVADDDAAPPPPPTTPVISITADGDITEGGAATFTVAASPAPAANLDVTVSVTQSGDFGVTPGAQTVTIPTTGSVPLTVSTADDSVDEATGAVTATVDSGQGYTVSATAGSATVAVADDDAAPPPPPATPVISIAGDGDITEGGDATFTLTANPAPAAPLDVTVSVTQSGDYGVSPVSHTVTLSTGGTGTLTLTTADDTTDEPNGSVTATVTDGTDYDVSATAGAATVEIADDDPASTRLPPSQVSFAVEDAAATEGTMLRFQVRLSQAATKPVRVYWKTRYHYAGTAPAFPGRDYPERRGWLRFAPGATEQEVELPLGDDTVSEPDETFLVHLVFTEGGATVADREGIMTIVDDDAGSTAMNSAPGAPAAPPAPRPVAAPADAPPAPDYTALITQMYAWRHDPPWRADPAYTTRWDRALLAFGQPVTDPTLTPLTAAEAQAFADRGMMRWMEVAAALWEIEAADAAAEDVAPVMPDPYAGLIAQMYAWRHDPQWRADTAHTDQWDRVLLAFGEAVTDPTLTPMTAAEAQAFADQGLTRWEDVAAALQELEAAE